MAVRLMEGGTELVEEVYASSNLLEDLIKILICFLILSLFPWSSAFADSRTTSLNDRVLVMLNYDLTADPHPVSAVIKEIDMDGNVRVAFDFIQDGSWQTGEESFHLTSVVKEVSTLKSFKTQDLVCLKQQTHLGPAGTSVKIEHLFANGAAEIKSRKISVQGFTIFRKKEIINMNALQPCDLKLNGSPP